MSILKKPIISEKISEQNESGKYGFVVDINANKIEIRKAVEQMYGVSVAEVNTMTYGGKSKSRYSKQRIVSGKTSAYKKAIITVADGEVIDFYSDI